jgi:hypothetical protein
MLTIFRRHLKACPQTSRRYRRRQCPIWIEGTLGLEDVPRRSLNLTSWDAAEEYVRESNRTGKVGGTSAKPMLIADTVELYLADVQSRVRTSTVRLHRVLLRDSLLVWCAEKGYRYLSELDVKALIEYRSSWQFAPLTALKKFERLRSFFRFCHAAKWMPENPTLAIRAPKADTPPTLPFTNEEVDRVPPSVAKILAGTRKYRLGLTAAHQSLRPVYEADQTVAAALLANAATRVVFRVGEDDAKKLADGFTSFDAQSLVSLGVGEAVCRIDRADHDFNLRTRVPAAVAAATAAARRATIVAKSRSRERSTACKTKQPRLITRLQPQNRHHRRLRRRPRKDSLICRKKSNPATLQRRS